MVVTIGDLVPFILVTDIDDLNEQLNGERLQVQQVNGINLRFYIVSQTVQADFKAVKGYQFVLV